MARLAVGDSDFSATTQNQTPRSTHLATNLLGYNGEIESTVQDPPEDSELGVADRDHLTMVSYLLDSVFTHRSARYALEGALRGFATDTVLLRANLDLVLFSERNSEAMIAPDNDVYGSVGQDDYDSWVGEAALVRWGEGAYSDEGWIKYNRHATRSNYIFRDGHAETLGWRKVRENQFPDRRVRQPLDDPPN